MTTTIFPTDLPERQWSTFAAEGFRSPVTGVIHRGTNPPVCGVPLGGIDTGCIDLEADGTLGYVTAFNSFVPHRGPLHAPFLGLSVGLQAWVLTTLDLRYRDDIQWRDLGKWRLYKGLRTAAEIHCWGHYPVADFEFVTDAPVTVGLRAWAPFVPGDAATSNTPAGMFEVHLRNATTEAQKGTLAFSFPGPSEEESGTAPLRRRPLSGKIRGVSVGNRQAGFALAAVGESAVRTGGELGSDGTAWASIEDRLPFAVRQPGASVAVDFNLVPREQRIVRFVLAWHSPVWMGSGSMTGGGNPYTHQYAARHGNAAAAARFLARGHASVLKRILAWQQAIYSDTGTPGWLHDTLVNILHLIPETSVWAQGKPPVGAWCRPEDGLFGLSESPRWCPQIECIPCSFYGNLPLVYFFPALALSTLRGYRAYQYANGAAPFIWGDPRPDNNPYEMTLPSPGYDHKPQATLDGPCYAEMVDKLWRRTGDPAVLAEFYDSVKRNTIYTMNLRPGSGAAGIVSMPAGNEGQDWYENCDLFGIVPHIGGVHLAQVRIAHRMATAAGDGDFALQCERWLAEGSEVMEREAWAGTHYMLFTEPETGRRSDIVMAYQLDGEWMARFHGLPGVFKPDRVATTLKTLKATSVTMSPFGAVTFCRPTAQRLTGEDWNPGYWGSHGVAPVGTFMLAMTWMYEGEREFGIDLARRTVKEVISRGWYWDWPVCIDSADGPRYGFDYYQLMILWSLPAAFAGEDLAGPCRPGGLVDRVLAAASRGRSRRARGKTP